MKRKILIFAAAAAMLCACSSNDIPTPVVDAMTDTPVTVRATVAELDTRIGHEAGALTSGSMGLFFHTDADPTHSSYNADNRKVKYADGAWTIQDAPLLWKNSSEKVSYYAYHPYVENSYMENKQIIVAAEVDQYVTDGDFLYAKSVNTTGLASEQGIDITFEHKMAKLVVNFTRGTEIESEASIGEVIVENTFIWRPFLLEDGIWGDITATESAPVTMNNTQGDTFEAILIPQTVKNFRLKISMPYRTFVYEKTDLELKAGMVNTLNLRIGKDKVTMQSVSAQNWTSGTTGNLETE